MTTPTLIGAALREARVARGLDVRQCAEAVYIRARYLAAIEDGRFDDLPDAAYINGFVRAYAEYLNVPVEGLVEPDRELPVRLAGERRRPVYLTASRHRRSVRRRRGGWGLWFAVVAGAAIVAGAIALWLGALGSPGL